MKERKTLHITDVLKLAGRTLTPATQNQAVSVTALFFDHHPGKYDQWTPGKTGVLTVTIRGFAPLGDPFEISLDVDGQGVCHRQQEVGIKKRFAFLQSLIQTTPRER